MEATSIAQAALCKQNHGERSDDSGASSLDEADDLVNGLPKAFTATRAVAPDRFGVEGNFAHP